MSQSPLPPNLYRGWTTLGVPFLGRTPLRRILWGLLIVALLTGYWLLPIRGQIIIRTGPEQGYGGTWPQVQIDPLASRPDERVTLYVRDIAPWPYVKLLVDGVEVQRDEAYPTGNGPWAWRWHFLAPQAPSYEAVLYHDCQQGCIERMRTSVGVVAVHPTAVPRPIPSKLGVVFADTARNWHGRSVWTVELTYVQRQQDLDFGIDGLAQRVQQALRRGLRPLVRIAYDQRQSLPPANDEVALARYLEYCARLARDDRLRGVYGFFVGSGYNTAGENTLAPNRPTTPEWYARVFNGYGIAPARGDNVVQTIRAVNGDVQVLVGPVTPWATDQNGEMRDPLDVPWLNYFNTVVAYIDTAVEAKSRAGIPLAMPDGFALQAPGRPSAPEVQTEPAREPATDLHRPEWRAAQAGFRVYRDWLNIINRYATTGGRPVYITSTNTWTSDVQVPPAQNYPAGWFTTAVSEVNKEPQIQALCWFVDAPLGGVWTEFSLSKHPGQLNDAASEFDRLLRQ